MEHIRTLIPNGYYRAPNFRYKEVKDWFRASPFGTPTFPNRHQNYYAKMLQADGSQPVSAAVFEASAINAVEYARTVMTALLFAKAPVASISEITEVPEDTVEAYQDLFFDPEVFRNRLLKTAYVQSLPYDTEGDSFHKEMLNWAITLGWEYVEWRVTGVNAEMPVLRMLKGLLCDSLWRSKEHIFNRLDDPTAREARAWLPHTIRLAEAVTKLDNDKITSIEELRIELTGLDITTNRNKLGSEIKIYSASPA